MRDAVVAATLQDVEGADDVAFHIGMRSLQRMPHAGLGAQVHDAVESLGGE